MRDPRLLALGFLIEVDYGRHIDQLTLHSSFQSLGPADRSLAKELVYGCTRQKLLLDHSLSHHSARPLTRLDLAVLCLLRLGAYQIIFLRVPEHAAVHTSVRLCRKVGFQSASGFVNAVLRNLIRKPVLPPAGNEPAQLAIRYSHPEWLVSRYLRRWGSKLSCQYMGQNNRPAEAVFWVNPRRGSPRDFLGKLEQAGYQGHLHSELPQSVSLDSGAVAEVRGWSEFGFLMDEGSQRVVAGVSGEEGRFGDLCAAPGGKTFQLESQLSGSVRLLVCDISCNRLNQLRRRASQLGIEDLKVIQSDATKPPFRRASFDFLLLDVPCSGLGTIRSNPDIRWRFQESDLAHLQGRQCEMLSAGVGLLKPDGGSLIYATCSTEPEENQEVVQAVLGQHPGSLRLKSSCQNFPQRSPGNSFFWAELIRDSE